MRQILPSRRGPSARGAASVEMAICMLVIVPVFLYALFLDDLLRYSLDEQEAALSTVWDYAVQDYVSKGDPEPVQHQARLMFCDHESGQDRYNEMTPKEDGTQAYKDCEGQDHHKSLAAHQCWINPNAKQVTCEGPDKGAGSVNADQIFNSYHGQFTQGGLYKCSAILVVENYLLPKSFLPEFSDDHGEVKLTKDQWQGDYHQNANQGTGGKDGTAYFIKEQRLAIITDTWALTEPADYAPGQKRSGEMYARVVNIYQNKTNVGYTEMSTAASSFFSSAMDELLNPAIVGPLAAPGDSNAEVMNADDPRQPNISIHPQKSGTPTESINQGGGGSSDYFDTEWKDWDQDRNKKTYDARGQFYMGCKNAEEC